MKYALLCRHTTKGKKHITIAGIKKIVNTFTAMIHRLTYREIMTRVTDAFHGVEIRTSETMMTALAVYYSGYLYESVIHEDPIKQLGDDEWGTALKQRGLMDNLATQGTLFKATKLTLGETFENECEECANGVREIFKKMTGNLAVGFFHSPTIEMAAHALGWSEMPNDLQLDDLDGILFKEESCKISVLGVMCARPISSMEAVG